MTSLWDRKLCCQVRSGHIRQLWTTVCSTINGRTHHTTLTISQSGWLAYVWRHHTVSEDGRRHKLWRHRYVGCCADSDDVDRGDEPLRGGQEGGVSSSPRNVILLALSLSFLRFIRRFWNQTLTWRSLRCSLHAISQRFCRVMYELETNSCSRTIVW